MTKTELLNKLSTSTDERLLLARTLDKLDLARNRSIPAHTPFLSLAERAAVERLIAFAGHPAHLFWGGYEGAERTICAFLPDWLEPQDWQEGEDCPLAAVELTFPADAGLTHRDFLGSILGLGITREKVGDLLVGEGRCQAVVLREIQHVLLTQLEQVGRKKGRAAPLELESLVPPVQETKTIRDTVATMRLDAVAASGFSTSRSKMADYISGGRVAINGRECLKADRIVEEQDVLTCRGLGKCLVAEVLGQSKKGRVMLRLERYL